MISGTREQTHDAARARLTGLPSDAVAWIGEADDPPGFVVVSPRAVGTVLGRSFDAVVLDAHDGLDADVLGLAHGLARGGGVLLLRVGAEGLEPGPAMQARLAAHPFEAKDVGRRFHAHARRALDRLALDDGAPLRPPPPPPAEHPQQARVVERLVQAWSGPRVTRIALLADRGRGKSSALGLAVGRLPSDRSVVVSAAQVEAVGELWRFATGSPRPPSEGRVRFVPLTKLVFDAERADVIVIDEAAQLPVPLLRRLVERHPRTHLAFSTTTHGYEGTGRGFSLRFLEWLRRGEVPVETLELTEPIRWDAGDPLERLVFDALLLDAEPAAIEAGSLGELEAMRIDRDALLADETRLRELLGLLVHAHYRTTPSDLHRMLDAPNLELHALCSAGRVVAVTVLAHEGELPEALVDDVLHGRTRLRAHALADALVAHLGHPEAGALRMVRSVRIATHPALRRQGLATRLVEHVHREHAPDLFGTLFGATPELLAFRRRVGYEVVRLSASRGARTGEPSVMMLRPVSERARTLVQQLRAELARDLPRQLELLRADGETLLDPGLVSALLLDLPSPAPLDDARVEQLARAYAFGPRTFESVALALARLVEQHADRLARLDPDTRRLVEGRIRNGHGWRRVAVEARQPTVPAAMRALRRAVRSLLKG